MIDAVTSGSELSVSFSESIVGIVSRAFETESMLIGSNYIRRALRRQGELERYIHAFNSYFDARTKSWSVMSEHPSHR